MVYARESRLIQPQSKKQESENSVGSSLYALGPRDPRVLLRKRLAAPRGLASDDLCFFTILERRDLSLYIRYRQKVDMYLISAT